jgi:GTP-binding protein
MTQTRFVLQKAIALGLNPIVVMNKVDRESSRPEQVDSELLELFMNLEATDEQMEYPIVYGLSEKINKFSKCQTRLGC